MAHCYLHRSSLDDVARVENLTFICSRLKADAGPTNNWMDPHEATTKLSGISAGSMRGRTMYVIPFIMGPAGSSFSKIGIQITDSRYVTLSMRVMTRMGAVALKELGESGSFTRCMHAKADLNPQRRYICHFPEDNMIWSVGSAYGGNALLGKKCLALRIGSYLGKQQGWMAEHMLIAGIEDPQGQSPLHRGGLPQPVRQDQFGHDDSSGSAARLQALDGGGRHRLAPDRVRRPALGSKPGGGIFRRGAGHQRQNQPHRDGDDPEEHDFHERPEDR